MCTVAQRAEIAEKVHKPPNVINFELNGFNYSIVKDSSADLGVNFKIVQNRPTVKAVCTKISFFFFSYLSIFLYF